MPYFIFLGIFLTCFTPIFLTDWIDVTFIQKLWYDVVYDNFGYWNMYFNYGFSGDIV